MTKNKELDEIKKDLSPEGKKYFDNHKKASIRTKNGMITFFEVVDKPGSKNIVGYSLLGHGSDRKGDNPDSEGIQLDFKTREEADRAQNFVRDLEGLEKMTTKEVAQRLKDFLKEK